MALVTVQERLGYYRRVFSAYLRPEKSHLSFWHDVPEANANAQVDELGEYYMPFTAKADYSGPRDASGIPLLDYRGSLGVQYNPIAIAQYGLGNYNLFLRTGDPGRRQKFLAVADWLTAKLEQNGDGLWVWNHGFDWEYRTTLRAPWQSALAQGQGISLLVRAHLETDRTHYIDAAHRAFQPFLKPVEEGGVTLVDDSGYKWFEEYVVAPPTHILNGFIWASLGVHDYFLSTHEPSAKALFEEAVRTLVSNLPRYDIGFWSLYEQSGTRLRMVASPFYHRLHIVQLDVLFRLTGEKVFQQYATRWDGYRRNRLRRTMALAYKAVFKLFYY